MIMLEHARSCGTWKGAGPRKGIPRVLAVPGGFRSPGVVWCVPYYSGQNKCLSLYYSRIPAFNYSGKEIQLFRGISLLNQILEWYSNYLPVK